MLGWNSIPDALVTWRVVPTIGVRGARLNVRIPTTSAAITTAATPAGTAHLFGVGLGCAASGFAGVLAPLVTEKGSSAACSSSAVWKRSAGCFARHRRTIAER